MTVTNWHGSVSSSPARVVNVTRVDEIVTALLNPADYPPPVRPVGSNHSVTEVNVANGGTLLDMTAMNRILAIDENPAAPTVIAEAGARFIDVAHALRGNRDGHDEPYAPGLQFYVNTEIGNLTLGAAATAATKSASFYPDEFGQVGSYVTQVKLVRPNGQLATVSGEELKVVRSSYGLLGVVYEVTMAVRRHEMMAVRHEQMTLNEFIARFAELNALRDSVRMFLFPYDDRVVVEYRNYTGKITGPTNPEIFQIRNFIWKWGAPVVGAVVNLAPPLPRFGSRMVSDELESIIDRGLEFGLEHGLHADSTSPTDQIVEFEHTPGLERYAFSMWAFCATNFPLVLSEYFSFCKDFEVRTDFRTSMPHISYRIRQDRSALLSYSYDNDVWTLDPVSAGTEPQWPEFLCEFNQLCTRHDGRPLFNQTPNLTPTQAYQAYGERLTEFERERRRHDPRNRLLNPHFKHLLSRAAKQV